MLTQKVPPRDVLLIRVSSKRQRAHTGIRVKHNLTRQSGIWKRTVRLRQQVLDFPDFGADVFRRILKANVSRSDQEVPVPRNNEKRAPITNGLKINRTLWRAGKRRHHNMTPLRSTD